MRNVSRWVGPLLATAAAVACAPAMMGSTEGDEAAIRSVSADWQRAVAARDLDRIVAHHTADAIVATPNSPSVTGTAEVRRAWSDAFGMNPTLTWQPTRITVAASRDLAAEFGTYQMSFDTPGGRVNDSGSYSTVWRKVGNDWRVSSDAVTSSVPMPAPVNISRMFDTSMTMGMHAAAGTNWTDLVVPGFPSGAKMSLVHGDPGAENDYTLRLWFPDGYEFPAHWHPKAEHVTVLSGSLHLAMGDVASRTAVRNYGPGDFLYLPARQAHFGGATGETVVQLHGIGPFAINVGPSPR